jgi:hypothetical protein
MIDYIEGVIELKQRLQGIEDAMLKKDIRGARLLLADIRFLAEETDSHLCKQFPRETGHG